MGNRDEPKPHRHRDRGARTFAVFARRYGINTGLVDRHSTRVNGMKHLALVAIGIAAQMTGAAAHSQELVNLNTWFSASRGDHLTTTAARLGGHSGRSAARRRRLRLRDGAARRAGVQPSRPASGGYCATGQLLEPGARRQLHHLGSALGRACCGRRLHARASRRLCLRDAARRLSAAAQLLEPEP